MTLAQLMALFEVENPPPEMAGVADLAPFARFQGG